MRERRKNPPILQREKSKFAGTEEESPILQREKSKFWGTEEESPDPAKGEK
ncbi:hypothetical protein QA612_00635 [Evansella sp. AB-P1]|uniref:hypothetical protein n=1 Tax=Evansella sp. AB-P1 TaxID=3037653 RepID=UPI00241F0125|nr:hypothetical protein [Evansella sp. AB-P1]MDG5785977.1 hypothetical protein [Evansella sp. AB-P1]